MTTRIIKILMSTPFLLGIPVVALVLSIVAALIYKDFSWFQRSGSRITIFGVVLTLRKTIVQSFDEQFHTRSPYAVYAPEEDSAEMQNRKRNIKKEIAIEKIGLAITIIGTGIWGYGDLIGKIIFLK